MYHKRQPKATESLAEWIEKNHPKQATPKKDGEFVWHQSKYKPPVDDIKETQADEEERAEVPKIKQYEETFNEENEKMTDPTLVSKLKDEKQELIDKTLKIDDKIIDPVGVSDYQIKLLKVQRDMMRGLTHIFNLRIDDLSKKDK